MFKLYQLLKKHKKKLSMYNHTKGVLIITLFLCVFSNICISMILFSDIKFPHENNILYKYLFDMLNLVFILISFILLQWTKFLVKEAYVILSVGLFLWGCSVLTTIYNDVSIQPIWVSLWIYNVFKTIGILLLLTGIIIAIKKTNKQCNYFKMLATIDDLTELPSLNMVNKILPLLAIG